MWTNQEWEHRDAARMRRVDRRFSDKRQNTLPYRLWFEIACTVRKNRLPKGFVSPDGIERAAALAAVHQDTIGSAKDAIEQVFTAMESRAQ